MTPTATRAVGVFVSGGSRGAGVRQARMAVWPTITNPALSAKRVGRSDRVFVRMVQWCRRAGPESPELLVDITKEILAFPLVKESVPLPFGYLVGCLFINRAKVIGRRPRVFCPKIIRLKSRGHLFR